MIEKLAEVITALAVIFVAAALTVALIRLWIGSVADVIWMAVLRPSLAIIIAISVAFALLTLIYLFLPQRAGAPVALPLLAIVILVPVLLRPMINIGARWRFTRKDGPFKLDRDSLKLADVFLLEELRLRTVYKAPASERLAEAELRRSSTTSHL